MCRPLALCLLATVLALLPGCGDDPSPGDAEPRRTLDPQAEAVRFFGARTRTVVLLRSDMPRPARELAALAAGYPGPAEVLTEAGSVLAAGGIDPGELLRLGRNEEGEAPGTQLAAGLAESPEGGRILLVMPTDRPADLDELLASAAAAGPLNPAGEYDNAKLYRAPGAGLATRDGVLVAASTLVEVRRALTIRDGEESRRLDDGEISSALEDVPTRAPIHIVARRGERLAGIAIRPDGEGGAELRIAADVPEEQADTDEAPHRETVEADNLAALLGEGAGLPEEVAGRLAEVAPLRGASYVDGDRYIATFTVEDR